MCSTFLVPFSDTPLSPFVGRLALDGFHDVCKRFFSLAESPLSGLFFFSVMMLPLILSPPDLKSLLLGPLGELLLLGLGLERRACPLESPEFQECVWGWFSWTLFPGPRETPGQATSSIPPLPTAQFSLRSLTCVFLRLLLRGFCCVGISN